MKPGNGEHPPRDPRQLDGLDTYPVAQVEAFVERIDELEAENKSLRDAVSDADTERNAAQAALKAAFARVAELEAREKQARDDEAWANDRTVLVEFQPVTSGWYASAPDGVVGINATAPTIHGALRAMREKMEARP